MLQQRTTRIVRTRHNPVVSGEIINEEGMALVYVKEDGVTKVKKSAGDAGEIFAGVSLSRNSPPSILPLVQEEAIPAGLTVQLARTPVTGQLLVKVAGVQVTVGSTAPADATAVQLTGSTLTFFAGEAGKEVSAQFLYTPTVIEARTVIGDVNIGGLSSTAQGVIGTLHDAEFGTNMYDAGADWAAAFYVKTAAGGTFTVGTAADHTPGVIVKEAPSAANPFLVLAVQVAG